MSLIPFNTYLWKISSRCNLDCTYCYVYNSVDQRWRLQPKFMSEDVARQTARRMREHLAAHGKEECSVIFHGGEALLGGVSHLEMLATVIEEDLRGAGLEVTIGMQSNALLFTPEIGDLMLEHGMTMGVSIDGPPEINDRYRVDHRGRGSSAELERRLELLLSDRYRPISTGFLCVINPDHDPLAVSDYLFSYRPSPVDFLLPLDNYDRLPPGKEEGYRSSATYGEWLITIFDHWWAQGKPCAVRFFDSILCMLVGGHSKSESLGVDPVDLVVVEANGEIEAVDSLKTTFDGASELGYNIHDHTFNEVARDMRVRQRQIGVDGLCDTCAECPVVEVCGGGYVPHRYSSKNGFDNPSVYCRDLELMIRHIHERLLRSIHATDMRIELSDDDASEILSLVQPQLESPLQKHA